MPPRSTTWIVAVVVGEVALDAVAGEAGDLVDRRVEGDERAQRPVAEAVAGRAGGEHLLHERHLRAASRRSARCRR